MRRGFIQVLKFLAFLIVGVFLLWLAFRKTNFNVLWSELRVANYSWLFLSVFFGALAYLSRARRWELLINPLGFRPTFLNTFYSLMVGYIANLALPRIGEITRCVALGKKEKIPVDQLIGTVVVERTIDFFSLMIILVALIFTSSDTIVNFLRESIFKPLQEKIYLVFGVTWVLWAILLLIMIAGIIFLIRYKQNLRKFRFFAKVFDVLRGIVNGLKTITSLERKWEFIFHTLFIWLNYALMTWVIVFALESTSHITFPQSIFLLVIGGLAMAAPVQGGLGVFHYTISRGLIIMGVPMEDGLVYALLTHESQLIFVAIIGALSFFLLFRKDKEDEFDPINPLEGEK
ncbi:MAG TPA: lysylphosphatidylglycerol synthase transmembrane domain-containing protein [Bacteroidales bacterium]|nr:lysylphosphatidylglycerol synthase transmembrane domain-containing protein [Bacteroidales bacterium]